ncbi:M23 family metallopeptidase [Roseivirga sp.]|uniref:M23 family metallopeptidase n=1 Tax=Roseivirga sp. TaxID=1964215 RepID=UPI003B8CF6DD
MKINNITILMILLLIIGQSSLLAMQSDISFEARSKGDTMKLYISNPKPYAQTVSLKLAYSKMKLDGELKEFIVVPPNTDNFVAAKFFMEDIAASKLNWAGSQYFMGDIYAKHDDEYVYSLPYRKGDSYKIITPNNAENYFLLIGMSEGTPIRAARDGEVLLVRSDSETGCAVVDCAKFANYIIIRHSDGTMALYSHLRKNGVDVKVGDLVKAGDYIGSSGNTGWSKSPRLRFEVFKGNKTIETKFRLSKKSTGYIENGMKYKSR